MRLLSPIRLLVAVSVSAFALTTFAPTSADAQSRGARKAKAENQARAKRSARGVRVAQRPASVGANGLCQRDTGTPDSQLDFRNRCDAEEFWRRINDRGSAGER